MSMLREFGDLYGAHALKAAGGDNIQRDVLHVVGQKGRDRFAIHPTRLCPEYVGLHRIGSVEMVRVVVGSGDNWVLRSVAGWYR